ncbi:MAG: roadblock/LC7 domain-containing protein [Promethearchaeota archaeon]|jgi:predicted regulator of Ras-like GTPase activity (Roadblock/LC7/MglB family)
MTLNSQIELSNKDRILNLLKSGTLTSNQIASKLSLSNQDTRTYLLRLKKENKIKTIGKQGRYYLYTYNIPKSIEKPHIDTNTLAEVLKEYFEIEPGFKNEVKKKIAELEARVSTIASETFDSSKKEKLAEEQKSLFNTELERELKMFEFLSNQTSTPPSDQMLEFPIPQLDSTLQSLLVAVPSIKAAAIVSTKGVPIASALPQGINETTTATLMASLISLAERAVIEVKTGEFEQLYVKGKEGYLLVLPAGPNAVLAFSVSSDVELELVFVDAKRTSNEIAGLIRI